MKTATQVAEIQNEITLDKSFAIDTTFVLFFLAIEFGQSIGAGIFENFFLGDAPGYCGFTLFYLCGRETEFRELVFRPGADLRICPFARGGV